MKNITNSMQNIMKTISGRPIEVFSNLIICINNRDLNIVMHTV